jgi:hypothetical protein
MLDSPEAWALVRRPSWNRQPSVKVLDSTLITWSSLRRAKMAWRLREEFLDVEANDLRVVIGLIFRGTPKNSGMMAWKSRCRAMTGVERVLSRRYLPALGISLNGSISATEDRENRNEKVEVSNFAWCRRL